MSVTLPARLLAAGLGAAMLAAGPDAAFAQAGPFGVGLPEQAMGAPGGGPLGQLFGYVAAQQSAFYRALTQALSAFEETGGAPLIWLSFAYGVFHAAGPGHGKVVLTSYILADGATLRRGIALSFAAAAVQATSAVLLVAVLAGVLRATSLAMTNAAWWLEVASYALVMALGAWLLARKMGLWRVFRPARARPATLGAAAVPHAGHGDDCACGHAHMPTARDMRAMSGRAAISTVLAIGLRPCTGAIIVLVFALSQGLFPAGIAAAYLMALGTAITVSAIAIVAVAAKGLAVRLLSNRRGGAAASRLIAGIEIAGAALVFLFGLVLLGGALSAS